MPTDALFEKLRLAERRLTAAEERVSFCRAVNLFQDRATLPSMRTLLSA